MIALLLLAVIAAAGLALAFYAHRRLHVHTAHRSHAEIARAVLIGLALAVGWTAAGWYPTGSGFADVLLFLAGFGWVHLPAAFILWSKRLRGVYR